MNHASCLRPVKSSLPGLRLCALGTLLLAVVVSARATDVVDQVVAYVQAHPAGDVGGSFRAADYRGDLHDLPIGVFDSGIGGLTVFEAIKAYDAHNNVTGADGADGVPDFANERFIYLGDQANMPYGNYTSAGHLDFLRELVLRDVLFLLGRRAAHLDTKGGLTLAEKPPVKAIVIACNTATAVGLNDVRQAIKSWGIPIYVIGVIEAGAHATVTNGRPGGIAVFSTVATCSSEAYPRAIVQAAAEQQLAARPVYQAGLPTLAAAIEGDPSIQLSTKEIVQAEIRAFLAKREAEHVQGQIDTLVFGCTHYPLVRQEFAQALAEEAKHPSSLLSPTVAFVDPAETTAAELYRTLTAQKLWATKPVGAFDRFYISVANPKSPGVQLDADGGLTKDYKYSRSPGQPGRDDTAVVLMGTDTLPASGATLIRDHLPLTWAGIQKQ